MKLSDKSVCEDPIFRKIYEDNAKILHNFIYYKTGSPDKAADITQEAFIKLWQNCAKVPLEKAVSFLYKVAGNLFLNDAAHEKVKLKYQNQQHTGGQFTTQDAPEDTPEETYMKHLEAAIQNLSDAQRQAFLLNRIDGKKYTEIADALGISVKAVEKRISGALKSIRDELKNLNI